MSEKNISESGSDKPDQPEVRYVPVEYYQQEDKEAEIGILDFIKFIFLNRKTVFSFALVFFVFGMFIYLFGPEEYKSDSILIQETQQAGAQQLQILQNLGGFGGGGSSTIGGEGIPPSLYPDIVSSVEFQRRIMYEDIEFSEYELNTSLYNFFNEYYSPPFTERLALFVRDYTIRLPFTIYRGIRNLFQSNEIEGGQTEEIIEDEGRYLSLTSRERSIINDLIERVEITTGGALITVTTTLPDPKAAAEINFIVVNLIQEYVIDYRIEKARKNLSFIEEQVDEAKTRYDEAQRKLAEFRDQNVSLATATARTQQEELQYVRDVRFNVYNSLAQEVEQARIKLQEDTPVFNVLQKSFIPTSSESGSIFIVIGAVIFGIIAGIGWVFFKHGLNIVTRHINS